MNQHFSHGDIAFRFTSNRLCLDFLATKGEVGHRDIERIGSPLAYSAWIAASGILDRDPLVSPSEVDEAIEFREVMRSYFLDLVNGAAPDSTAVAAINRAARRPVPRLELSQSGTSVSKQADVAGDSALSSVARDVLSLVVEGQIARVKQCNDPTCCMFFLDKSRANNRIWCATEGRGCGNKAKKRAFRSRQKELV
ncbi:ABATE domain-containing protein [Rhizobium sp. 16-449-1b]|uniref:CGNR zinc finger domain-containing protein n=1 Tax=Rhizobium sp. 16-449-1b TaxID=2819989 RepID=UPI001ADCF897|nr:CGNR zinc finger domain-containing protein [Rhizobium sp. 16-449-1b]MBO9195920.1 ABATE domain-containing protein [Rhizobium sp. 16-449-1b]